MAEQTTGGDTQTAKTQTAKTTTSTTAAGAQTEQQQQQTQQTQQTQQQQYSQADIDRAVQRAIETREKNLKAELESKALAEQGKFKEVAERAEARARALELDRDTARHLAEMGLPQLASAFELDVTTLDGRKAAAKAVKSLIDEAVEARVAERLKTKPATGNANGSTTPVRPDQMSPADWAKRRSELGIR